QVGGAEGETMQYLCRQEQQGIRGKREKRPADQAAEATQYQEPARPQPLEQPWCCGKEGDFSQDAKGPETTDEALAQARIAPVEASKAVEQCVARLQQRTGQQDGEKAAVAQQAPHPAASRPLPRRLGRQADAE